MIPCVHVFVFVSVCPRVSLLRIVIDHTISFRHSIVPSIEFVNFALDTICARMHEHER